mgnify:CR=1 FL=1
MNDILRDIVIIGTGSAGLTAGIYAARANLKPLILEGLQPGGQLTITTDVENYPGFSDVVQGPWLMDQMKAQALNVGAEIINELVTSVDFSDKYKIIKCDSGKIIKTKSVIICTGAQARWLGIESEKKFNGRGVSACATCDGFFYRNKNVAVIGGGNTAVEEALYLSNICTKFSFVKELYSCVECSEVVRAARRERRRPCASFGRGTGRRVAGRHQGSDWP